MLPLRDLRFQGPEGTFSKTKASQIVFIFKAPGSSPLGHGLVVY